MLLRLSKTLPIDLNASLFVLPLLCALSTLHFASCADILIKGGTVVNFDREVRADVLISGEFIKRVAPELQDPAGAIVLDATDKLVMPGGIDPHTHLDAPMFGTTSCDDFASGQSAALAGGTTMHIDFALPVDHDIQAGLRAYRRKARKAVMDYGFHMAVTKFDEKVAQDMEELAKQGITSFKFFMAYKGTLQVSDGELLAGFERCKELGALPMVHAENGDAIAAAQLKAIQDGFTGPEGQYISRPDILEVCYSLRTETAQDEATFRAIKLAELANVPLYVVHVMSAGAATIITEARKEGLRIVGEAVASGIAAPERAVFDADFRTPYALTLVHLGWRCLDIPPALQVASQYVMSPPIRSEDHQKTVRRALAGGILQIVGTDHCPFNSSQKAAGLHDFRAIPNGVNGIEERMHVSWDVMVNSGLMTPSDFVRATSTAAAQVFNIYPQKGVIAPGSDADVIIFDPDLEHTISASKHHSRIDQNIYEGRTQRGKVVTTISRGRIVWDGRRLDVTEGSGRFIEMPAFGPLFRGLGARGAVRLREKYPYGEIPVKRGRAKAREEL